ncbi:MAG: nucleotide sugar dehydrogenase [Candidatus Hydrogenedentota bacterium]|nr:MAG: nucleotide sugar dehydrogenase [Candidatus Hydrogenedentota bacterium]
MSSGKRVRRKKTHRERSFQKKVVGVVGMGYVGVPLAVTFGEAGHRVVGFDINEQRVGRLNAGEDVILDVPRGAVKRLRRAKRFRATTRFSAVRECDAVIFCVPTPLDEHKQPDLGPVKSAVEAVVPFLRRGQVLVLESTTFPGTTTEIIKPRIERAGWRIGRDIFLGFSPERVDPGNPRFHTKNTPKIISGVTAECLRRVRALYSGVVEKLVEVSRPEAAEMAKLLENIFRNVNIALVNELMLLCDRMGLDIWEVIDAAGTKPFGFMPFYPGPGVGGHCIPIDPFYLSWKAREYDFFTDFIILSAEVNDNIPYFVVEKTVREANARLGVAIRGLRVLVIGVAFKPNIDDPRNSPAEKIIAGLGKRGARVSYHDPYVPLFRVGEKTFRSVSLASRTAREADVVIIHTNHAGIDWREIARRAPLVIDTRNATKGLRRRNIVRI